jgi:type I restriction enzyme M protein
MRRSNCASALQYVPELTWILFLRILDAQEERERMAAEIQGRDFTPALVSPYRWQDWAAPYSDAPDHPLTSDGRPQGWKRRELFALGDGRLLNFINKSLLPHLHRLDLLSDGTPNPSASRKQRILGRIMTAVERVRVDSETNLADILDRVHRLSIGHIDDTHFFTLSQVYEDLLLKMGEKNSDGGQFFTPREVIRAMLLTLDPTPGETVYDPCCGTGGFLAEAFGHMARKLGDAPAATEIERLKHDTFFGREKENLVFPIALANLVLHGIDQPNLWHGNTLTATPTYAGLFGAAPGRFQVIFTNPPFGGKEGDDAQQRFPFRTGATQVLFLQQIMNELAEGGRCGIVLDEGLLFRTNERAFVETKRRLLDEFDLWCVLSLPGGVFSTAGAGVKTNLLFFTKGRPTERIWYYDLSGVKIGKKQPMTLAHFGFDKTGAVLDDDRLPDTLLRLLAEGAADSTEDREAIDTTPMPAADAAQSQPFPTFARLLASHGTADGESPLSWTLDITARREKAREEMAPHLKEAARQKALAITLRSELAVLRRAKAPDEKIEPIQSRLSAAERAAREAQAKADAIDAAVFDLKAVNPRARSDRDNRTPEQVLTAIAAHQRTIDLALKRLGRLLEADRLQGDLEPEARSGAPGLRPEPEHFELLPQD